MDIKTLQGKRFFLLSLNEEFLYEDHADGFVVIIGEDQFDLFKQKVTEKLENEEFYFKPLGLAYSDPNKESESLLVEYSHEFLETALSEVREITFEEVQTLDKLLGTKRSNDETCLFENMIKDSSGKKYTYLSWGYDYFYDCIIR
jgi:hypothetical protein